MKPTIVYTLIFVLASFMAFGQSSVLSSGKWYRIAVSQDGVYKITAAQLEKMGFNPGQTDPRKIRLYGQVGGMLPQSNAISRPVDLVESAIRIEGENDGVFNSGDYILFYGHGPDKKTFHYANDIYYYQTNLYSTKNYYFITVSEDNGKRISSHPAGSGGTIVNTYIDMVIHEKDDHNELHSGREWFGESFDITKEHSFNYELPGILENSTITLVSDVMAQSVVIPTFRIFFNNQLVGEQKVPKISGSQYGIKGEHKRDTLRFSASAVSASQNARQQIKYTFIPGESGRSNGYLDFFSLHFERRLALYGQQTVFQNRLNENARFAIENTRSDHEIWNISDHYTPIRQEFSHSGSVSSFTSDGKQFIVFNQDISSPELIGAVTNQDLHGVSVPDLVIVSHPDFKEEALRFAKHRQSNDGLATLVVTPQEIYNEFSSGRQDVTAIRDFMKNLYDRSPSKLRSLLLFGKGSYDYKDRIRGNTNFVPTYESRNSLAPLETYSSDDYFAFLENEEGEWNEKNPVQNHSMDIGVGRLPIKTAAEAKTIVDKIIDYDVSKKRFNKWRKDIVFVADDGSNSDGFNTIHQSQANTLAEVIEYSNPQFNTRKLFLGAYQKTVAPSGETIPAANDDLFKEFYKSSIINYTGHGSEKLWADERILNENTIAELDNKTYPFLVTATCEFGRNDDPLVVSSAELSIIREKAGSIGLVTTARPVEANPNFAINLAFYEALFDRENNEFNTIGEVFRRTKNNSTSGVSNRNFSLLGDPTLHLALPQTGITVDYIKTKSGSDTLKALSTVIVKGTVLNSEGVTDTEFNGTLTATLFDKRTEFETVGKNNPPYRFDQWYNPLFSGKASVVDGSFEVNFILPKNIAYEVGYGKLSLYAHNTQQTRDVTGGTTDFKIGLTEPDVSPDRDSPSISVYMGDTTFYEGGLVNPNTDLVVRLSDASGINISNYGIGNTLMAILDNDGEIFLINDYFTADNNDFTHGWIRFPMRNLSPGEHTITVKAWDTHNNPAEKTIRFRVSDSEAFIIETAGNFPNPFEDETTIFFIHNRPGDGLEVSLTLLDMAGKEIKEFQFTVESSNYRVDLLKLNDSRDLGKKLPPGLYLARLRVRSLSDGAGSEQIAKLIVSN